MKPVLLDTGVIVALLDKSERFHRQCIEVMGDISDPLITCEAVITESCYLLRNISGAADAILANVEKGIFSISLSLAPAAESIRKLMKTYADIPMDFADACLVHLANEYSTGRILTLDHDFNVYRWQRNKKFAHLLMSAGI
jgi:uncharacterized protein